MDWRKRRSLRQCPILETMIRTRGFWATGCSSNAMFSGDASSWNMEVRFSWLMLSGEAPPDDEGPKWTRMKKVREVASPYCWESTMLRSCLARKPVTAWTMPGRSGQESVRMQSFALLGTFEAAFVEVFGIVDEEEDAWA